MANKWDINGNTTTPGNFLGTVNNQPLNFRTNGIQRMLIFNGGTAQADGRIACGNNLPSNFVPLDRVHLFESATTGSVQTRYQNTNTGVTTTDGYAIGVDNSNRVVNHTQFEKREMRWLLPNARAGNAITEWMRIDNNKTSTYINNRSTDGYVGFNNANPSFHLDATTPAILATGELFLSFRTSDALATRMGMLNASSLTNIMVPAVFGNVDSTQYRSALLTIAAIKNNQDIATNTEAVTRFISGKEFQYNQTPVSEISSISNRPIFAWQNGGTIIKMHMNAKGQLRIGDSLTTLGTPARNRLEITADSTADPRGSDISINGTSGLRLTHLTSLKTPYTSNPGTGVLAVDSLGDVIYVPSNSGANIGNACGATTISPLTSDWEIPLNGYNYVFSDPATLTHGINNVRVGSSCNTPAFNAKFEVWRNSGTIPSTVTVIAGVLTVNSDKYPSYAPGQNSYGGYFIANGGSLSAPVNAANYGVLGIGRNARTNYGGYFEAAQPSLMGYGIYAKAISNGLGTGSLAGYFDGDVFINGVGNGSSGIFYTSDARLKTNIDTITNAIAIIKQLKPKTFYYDTTNAYGLRLSNKKQYGFIAQDVQTVLPELIGVAKKQQELDSLGNVVTDSITYNTVNYNAIIGLLTKAVQQQQSKIDSLTKQLEAKDSIQDARLTALENAITQCCSNTSARNANSNINQLDVELSDKDAIVLNQNVPNPFAEQTTITYNVPTSVEKAQLIFFNANGQVIQTVDIKTRGKGKVNVFASDLSSGLYHYTLVADGKVVDSKKMVRE